jgi:uncharacterized protein YjeT (DUF2065 family)
VIFSKPCAEAGLQHLQKNKFSTVDRETLWMAFALVLIVEGFLPFISPASWRRTFMQIMQLSDGQIRFIGLGCVLVGLVMLEWLK